MKLVTVAGLTVGLFGAGLVVAEDPLRFPQTRAATYDEIRAYQSLGRFVTAPDGSFFLYEWSRPYNWAPDVSWLDPSARPRTQTWVYRVDTYVPPERPDTTVTSKYAFYQDPNSTYYLGSLSPNNQRMSFYRINHDDEVVRAGVVTFNDAIRPTITYFEPAPDDSKLHLAGVWTSNDEIVYPVETGPTKLVRAKVPPAGEDRVNNGTTEPCVDCDPAMIEKAAMEEERAAKARLARKAKKPEKKPGNSWGVPEAPSEPPKSAKALARSENGELSIYSVDNADVLTLLFVKSDGTTTTMKTLFENERKPSKMAKKQE